MNREIFVSIVIPCFNEEENIGRCIDSIRRQSYGGPYEIIAIDNGSTDNTVSIIKDNGIILGNSERRGPAPAKNKGIEKAKGEIIVFADADCVAHPEWLKNIVAPFGDGEVGCVAGEILPYDPKTRIEKFLTEKKHLSQYVNVSHTFLPFAATANAAYRKEVFEKVGLFDEDLFTGEDADMSWRMQLQSGFKLGYSPEAVVYHPQETTLKGIFRQKQRHACGAVALYKKYRRFWPRQNRSWKRTYWEYRSLTVRLFKFTREYLTDNLKNPDESHIQTMLESGWKLGLIQGSLKYKVWFI